MQQIILQISQEIKVKPEQVKTAVELLDGGATVPFIARYRKEATGGLDDIQLRELEFRLSYLRELADRREVVLKAIDEQGKLTDALRLSIADCATKQELEDLYLPFKLKRRTKGQMAREAGLGAAGRQVVCRSDPEPSYRSRSLRHPVQTARRGRRQATRFLHRSGCFRRRARPVERALGRRRRAWCKACVNGCGTQACCKAS